MTFDLFEETYHDKWVKIKGDYFTTLKDVEGLVTAALYQHEDGNTILAIKVPDNWYTLHISPEEFDKAMADIEVKNITNIDEAV